MISKMNNKNPAINRYGMGADDAPADAFTSCIS